ncbi:MAG TPA: FlgD immunoglobulin-like domain containing protein, partial [Candidatus Krumholzibacterium sp.]|nr:FlgD immunoglobulin-like domain containing protein [Candidatus Krumholzibacterium sp.]
DDKEGLELIPAGDLVTGGRFSGDHSIINTIGEIPALLPGEGVRIDWAVVFGRSPERLAENVGRAVETYRGVRDGKDGWNRWIVPARKAERIEVPARLAPVWLQGKRMPAVSVVLPPESDEEVEWLKVSTCMIESFEQIEGRVVATVPTELIENGAPLLVEGQLSDGTIFRAMIGGDEIEIFNGDESTAPDKLPEDCLKIFPNPFVLDLNISLNVQEPPAELYRSADRATSGISSVRVYDVKGRLVRTVLEEEFLHPGEYSMGWDGKDENGIQVQPGVYYCKLQIGDRSVTKRVVLLR